MILFLILAILGELSILLHNIQPNLSLEPLQIVQVSSLFVYYSVASTIIKPQRVISLFTSQQHNYTNSCSCIPTLSFYHDRNIDFRPLDEKYGKNNKYVQKLMEIPTLKHFSNEKKCFQQLVPYYLNPSINSVCRSASDLIDFFNHNRKNLFFSCQDPHPYSHCQEFYVVTYDTMKDECSSFRRKPCMIFDGCSLSHAR